MGPGQEGLSCLLEVVAVVAECVTASLDVIFMLDGSTSVRQSSQPGGLDNWQ